MDEHDNTEQAEEPVTNNKPTGNRKLFFLHSLLVIAALASTIYFLPVSAYTSPPAKRFYKILIFPRWDVWEKIGFMEVLFSKSFMFDKYVRGREHYHVNGYVAPNKNGAEKLWETEPDNKVYLGNYLLQNIVDVDGYGGSGTRYHPRDNVVTISYDTYFYKRTKEEAHDNYLKLKETFEPLRKYDPDNGSFDFLLAASLVRGIIIKEPEEKYDENGNLKKYTPGEYDQELLKICMDHLQKATQKKYIRFYQKEFNREYFKIYGLPKTYYDLFVLQGYKPGNPYYQNYYYAVLTGISVDYVEQLLKDGKTEQALEISKSAEVLAKTLIIKSLVISQFQTAYRVTMSGKLATDKLKKHGLEVEAEQLQQSLDRIYNPLNKWWHYKRDNEEVIKQSYKYSALQNLFGRSGIIPGVRYKSAYYKNERAIDYIIFDRMVGYVVSFIFAGMIIFCLAVLLKNKLNKNDYTEPVFIKPDKKVFFRTSIFTYLILYTVIWGNSHGVREFSITTVYPVILMFGLFFISFLPFSEIDFYGMWLKEKLLERGIPVPLPLPFKQRLAKIIPVKINKFLEYVFGILFVMFIFSTFFITKILPLNVIIILSTIVFILILVFAIFTLYDGIKKLFKLRKSSEYRLFYLSFVRSFVPFMAIILLVFNIFYFPRLQQKEEDTIKRICDDLKPFGEIPGYASKQEKDVIRYLKKQYQDSK